MNKNEKVRTSEPQNFRTAEPENDSYPVKTIFLIKNEK